MAGKTQFIKRKQEVSEADKTKVFAKGERREDFADMWSNTGNILLVGLPGSNRVALGRELAARMGIQLCQPADMDALQRDCAEGNRVIVVPTAILEQPENVSFVHGAGKVFYLMADARQLAERLEDRSPSGDADSLWRECARRLEAGQAAFMTALHFIVQASGSVEDMAEDVMEKVSW
jgi:shikimate kinase